MTGRHGDPLQTRDDGLATRLNKQTAASAATLQTAPLMTSEGIRQKNGAARKGQDGNRGAVRSCGHQRFGLDPSALHIWKRLTVFVISS